MDNMFCFQCEQTAGGKGCVKTGVCGKKPDVANNQDKLICSLINLAISSEGKSPGKETDELVLQSLFATITNVNFDYDRIEELNSKVLIEIKRLKGIMYSIGDRTSDDFLDRMLKSIEEVENILKPYIRKGKVSKKKSV